MRLTEVGVAYNRGGTHKPYVYTYEQPWYRYLIYRAYHFYDMAWVRWKWLEAIYDWIDSYTPRDSSGMPWSANQDCRCYELSRKGAKNGAYIFITAEEWEKLGRDPSELKLE